MISWDQNKELRVNGALRGFLKVQFWQEEGRTCSPGRTSMRLPTETSSARTLCFRAKSGCPSDALSPVWQQMLHSMAHVEQHQQQGSLQQSQLHDAHAMLAQTQLSKQLHS